jgi:Raf kinase inhibitor-like YbhB/YbcL family protein
MSLSLTSPAFPSGGRIPVKYSRDGQNVSPPLAWRDAPEQTCSFAVVVEDPDAPSGTFRHWAIYNIGPAETELREGASEAKPGTVAQGVNDFGNRHYDGPQPPKGHGPHHYHFRLAALDVPRLDLPAGSRVEEVWKAARPHIIAEAEVIGIYER